MVLHNQDLRKAETIRRHERKFELIHRILDRTPYLRESPIYQQLQMKMFQRLTEDDLAILSLATRIEKKEE